MTDSHVTCMTFGTIECKVIELNTCWRAKFCLPYEHPMNRLLSYDKRRLALGVSTFRSARQLGREAQWYSIGANYLSEGEAVLALMDVCARLENTK